MKTLRSLIQHIDVEKVLGDLDRNIQGLTLDSRQVQEGFLFAAIPGSQVDGHQFISVAVSKGAGVILCEKLPEEMDSTLTYLQVKNSAEALGYIASEYYNHPSKQLRLVGVTGTNGKTSIASLLYQLTQELGYRSGLLSTVINKIGQKQINATHTTPDAVTINLLMAQMVESGCDFCFMEVSSHAIDQKRIAGLTFEGGIFTNLTRDHLDYHETFRNYINAKKAFFDTLSKHAFALTNADDKNGPVMLQNTKAAKHSYGLKSVADFSARILESHLDGMQLVIDGQEIWTPFIGNFNASNLLAVYATALLLGHKKEEVALSLSLLKPVPGRFETLRSTQGLTVIVDYAHTPDALENVLETINGVRTDEQQLITVVGAGGNRDKGKRPIMAQVAANASDKVILTSDNPRNEEPASILKDMQTGINPVQKKKVLVIEDRAQAIRTALMMGQPGDVILVAGKGHETYQEIKGKRYPFDDREEVRKVFNDLIEE